MDINNEYGVLKMQKSLLELMKKFDTFCISNKIEYSLAGGSLLGAIRHKGFIPWDDDLDVFLDRKNYELLKKTIKDSDLLSFAESDLSSLWIPRVRLFGKNPLDQYPPTLDIFIMDYVPHNSVCAKLKYYVVLACQGMIKTSLTLNKGNFIQKVCSFITYIIGRLFTTKFKFRLYDRISQMGNTKKATRVCWYNCLWNYIKYTFNRELIEKYIRVPFEDTELSITAEWDYCLSVEYGDYMKMPKVEHRIPKHLSGSAEVADLYMNKN